MLDFEFPEISEATAWKNYVDSFVLVEITQYVAGAASAFHILLKLSKIIPAHTDISIYHIT